MDGPYVHCTNARFFFLEIPPCRNFKYVTNQKPSYNFEHINALGTPIRSYILICTKTPKPAIHD